MGPVEARVFAFLSAGSLPATAYFRIPPRAGRGDGDAARDLRFLPERTADTFSETPSAAKEIGRESAGVAKSLTGPRRDHRRRHHRCDRTDGQAGRHRRARTGPDVLVAGPADSVRHDVVGRPRGADSRG